MYLAARIDAIKPAAKPDQAAHNFHRDAVQPKRHVLRR